MNVQAADALIALGSNLGDREAHLRFAFASLAALPGTELIGRSPTIETAPVGPGPQGAYLNASAMVHTSLAPHALLAALLEIERRAGRDRTSEVRWGPRTLDLDLLFHGQSVIGSPGSNSRPENASRALGELVLRLPHPRLHERLFVLQPLATIAPGWKHPVSGLSVARLLADQLARERGIE